MNFDEAIRAHAAWKLRLSGYLRNPDGTLQSLEVEASDRCALGKWLESGGQKYASLPEFNKLVEEHARFHTAAANVIEEANSGTRSGQDYILGATSEYSVASRNVIRAIKNLESIIETK
jgi:hypothetical protein